MPFRWKPSYSVALVCAIIGFMIATQVKSQLASSRQVIRRTDDLLAAFVVVDQQRAELRAEVELLRAAVSQDQTDVIRSQLNVAEVEAGLVPIRGPGVTVTMRGQGGSPILDEDIWKVINEIKAAGIEGLAVNNHRVTSRTAIRHDRVQLLMDGKPLIPPVVITAVGDPKIIEAALTLRGGPVQRLTGWLTIDIQREDNLFLPARESAEFNHAQRETQ